MARPTGCAGPRAGHRRRGPSSRDRPPVPAGRRRCRGGLRLARWPSRPGHRRGRREAGRPAPRGREPDGPADGARVHGDRGASHAHPSTERTRRQPTRARRRPQPPLGAHARRGPHDRARWTADHRHGERSRDGPEPRLRGRPGGCLGRAPAGAGRDTRRGASRGRRAGRWRPPRAAPHGRPGHQPTGCGRSCGRGPGGPTAAAQRWRVATSACPMRAESGSPRLQRTDRRDSARRPCPAGRWLGPRARGRAKGRGWRECPCRRRHPCVRARERAGRLHARDPPCRG